MRIVALAALVLVAAGCGGAGKTTGSGHVVTDSRRVSSFSAIDLRGAENVVVSVGPSTAVTITGDDNVVPLIRTDVRGGKLVIASKHGYSTNDELTIRVATPSLEGASMSGAGTLTGVGIAARSFSLDLSGTGRIELSGTTESLDATVAGVGAVELGNLRARDAVVTLAGTGSVRVHATRRLDATVAGVGSIRYSGDPSIVKTKIDGLGSISAG